MNRLSPFQLRSLSGALIAGILVLLLAQGGCFISQSSGSLSDSSGSLSDSSGSSADSSGSSSGGGDSAYIEDVRGHTLAIARSGGTPESLRRGLSEIALGAGISDWEAVESTYVAVGAGLASADLSEDQRLAYQRAIAAPGSPGFAAIERGLATASR